MSADCFGCAARHPPEPVAPRKCVAMTGASIAGRFGCCARTGIVNTDITVRTVGATHADLVAQVRAQLRAQSEAIHTSARRTGDPRPDPACIDACAHIRDINCFNLLTAAFAWAK